MQLKLYTPYLTRNGCKAILIPNNPIPLPMDAFFFRGVVFHDGKLFMADNDYHTSDAAIFEWNEDGTDAKNLYYHHEWEEEDLNCDIVDLWVEGSKFKMRREPL